MKFYWFIVFYSLLFYNISFRCLGQQRVNDSNLYQYKSSSEDGTGKLYLGREIATMQGFEGASWLERNNRAKEENTYKALKLFPIKSNSLIADLGAGTGYYTFKAAKMVPNGKVYAVEVQQQYILYLNKKIRDLGVSNVMVVKGTEKSPGLPLGKLDLIFLVDVYHEFLYPKEMLFGILKSLKPNGLILLLEYKGENEEVPIKPLHKMTIIQVDKELSANGFKKLSINETLPWQHLIIYQKK